MSLDALRNLLASSGGLQIGYIPKYRESELAARLSAVGVTLEVLPHEEG
jgi:hypothetical protein